MDEYHSHFRRAAGTYMSANNKCLFLFRLHVNKNRGADANYSLYYFISFHFHFISLLYNNQWLMSACGDIIEMEMTVGNLLKDEHQFPVQPGWCVWLVKVICV